MKKFMLLLLVVMLAGCSNVSQEELNAKINKCTTSDMAYTFLNDFRGKPYEVVCVRKHPNEK